MSIKLTHDERYDAERQANMLADLAAFLRKHDPYERSPLPPVTLQINHWAIAVNLEADDPQYSGQDFLGNPRRSRSQIADAWAAALGTTVVQHRWRDGRVQLAMVGHIGKPDRDGKPRTPIGFRVMLSPGDDGWTPPGQDCSERDIAAEADHQGSTDEVVEGGPR